MQKTVKEHR